MILISAKEFVEKNMPKPGSEATDKIEITIPEAFWGEVRNSCAYGEFAAGLRAKGTKRPAGVSVKQEVKIEAVQAVASSGSTGEADSAPAKAPKIRRIMRM